MRDLCLCPLLCAQARNSVLLHTGEYHTHDSFHKQVVCLLCSEKLCPLYTLEVESSYEFSSIGVFSRLLLEL